MISSKDGFTSICFNLHLRVNHLTGYRNINLSLLFVTDAKVSTPYTDAGHGFQIFNQFIKRSSYCSIDIIECYNFFLRLSR